MSPGSVCLGPPSAHYHFLEDILVSSKSSNLRETRQSPADCDDRPCQQGNVGKSHLHHPVPALPSASGLSPPASKPQPCFWLHGPSGRSYIGVCHQLHLWGGCAHGREPELLASTLAHTGRVSCQCHTATLVRGALDSVGTQEQNHCRGF